MSGTDNFSATSGAAGQQDYNANEPQQVNDDAQKDQANNPLFAAMQQQQQQAYLAAINAATMLQQQQQMQTLSTGIFPQVNMMMPQGQESVSAPQATVLLPQQQTALAPPQAASQQQQQPVSNPQAVAAPQQGAYAVTNQPLPQYYGGMVGMNVQQPLMGMVAGNPQQQQQMDPNTVTIPMDPNTAAIPMDPNTMLALQQLMVAQQQQAGVAAMNPWMQQAYQQQQVVNQQQPLVAPASYDGNAGLDVPAVKLKQPPRKKSKDKPKRPLSAYNYFFKEERARILEEIPSKKAKTDGDNDEEPDKKENSAEEAADDSKEVSDEVVAGDDGTNYRKRKKGPPHRKIGFENLAKLIAKRWKELGPDEAKYYKEKAAKDSLRYKNEMDAFMTKQREESERRMESIQGAAGEATESDDGGVDIFKE